MPSTQSEPLKWEPCFVDPKRGIAFFDGITIESDPITDPRWDRVLPVLEEEQIFVCRQMYLRFEQALKDKQDVWVLDVGTGNGVFAIWAAKKWKCKVVAIDINPRALMIAEKNASKNDITVCYSREELEKIAREKETGVILLECIKFDIAFREKYPHKFDLVFLSPSYTPIIDKKLLPPLYDTLGGDGQKSFQDQISLVPKILKEDGCCIGHQMTPVGSDKKMTALTKIQETFKEPWKVRYTHILDQPEELYSSREFLKKVYQFYLCPQESCNNLSRSRSINGSIKEFSKTNHYLAFLYYEVSIEEGKELIFRRYRVPKKNWDHRIKMHRAVVENSDHSSQGNFFPLPYLLTRESPIPQLPEINLGNLSETELTPQHQWENSPLKAVDWWINKAQILEFLDLIVVDIVPYDYLGGLQNIYQESKIWLQPKADKKLAKELLDEWLWTIQARKKAGVTQRLHPGFVGTNAPDQWRDIQYTLLQQKITSITSKFNLTEQEIEVLKSIVDELQTASQDSRKLPLNKIIFYDQSYSIWTLEDQDEYPDNEKMKERLKNMEIWEHGQRGNAILMDLRLCHLGIHQHLDKRYSQLLTQYDKKDYEWSALIGLPLSPSFHPIKGKIDAGIDNNSYYRGAFWIYARSSKQWALKQERKLFDLARFLWLMYESKYNAEAYASLYALKNFQASSIFGHEVKHISSAISHGWLMKPNDDLKKLVYDWYPEWGLSKEEWRIIPFPELLETAGKVIRLWCQTNNPRDIFNERLPRTMADFVQQCWQLAKDSIKPRLSYKYDLSDPSEIEKVKDLLAQVDQLWRDKFKIRVDEKVPKPDWNYEYSSQQWMELARLFLTAFGNCVKYANTEKDIIVEIKYLEYDDQKIEIAIINSKEDDASQSKLHDQIKMARQRVQTAPLIRLYSGTKIMSLYVIRLGGTLLKRPKNSNTELKRPNHPNTDIYKVEIRIPIKSLSGSPT
jgi:SAM-dependent methyltransferase